MVTVPVVSAMWACILAFLDHPSEPSELSATKISTNSHNKVPKGPLSWGQSDTNSGDQTGFEAPSSAVRDGATGLASSHTPKSAARRAGPTHTPVSLKCKLRGRKKTSSQAIAPQPGGVDSSRPLGWMLQRALYLGRRGFLRGTLRSIMSLLETNDPPYGT